MSNIEARRLLDEANAYFAAADREGRPLTDSEAMRVKGILQRAETVRSRQHVDDLGRSLGPPRPPKFVGLGDAVVDSSGYKSIQDPPARPQQFSVGPLSIPLLSKGTLLEAPGGGGLGLVSVAQVVPGIVDRLFQRLTFEDLLSAGQATGPTVRTVVEGTATSGAARVLEGGLKPESQLGFTTTDESIKKIATILPVSDELLDDAPAVRSFINSRVGFFIRMESERQLLRGTAGGAEIQGILTSRRVPVYSGGTAAGNRAIQLFKAMNGVRGSSFVEPDWIVLSPSDYEAIRLLTDTAGQRFGGGPFHGPCGSGVNVGASGQATGADDSLWGKPVFVTASLGAGTALIGSRPRLDRKDQQPCSPATKSDSWPTPPPCASTRTAPICGSRSTSSSCCPRRTGSPSAAT